MAWRPASDPSAAISPAWIRMSPGGMCGRSLYVSEMQTTVTGSSGSPGRLIGRRAEILRARKRQGPCRNCCHADGPFPLAARTARSVAYGWSSGLRISASPW